MYAEALVRSLLRLLVTVGILAAVYLLILKPILDTTSETVNRAFEANQGLEREINESLEQAGIDRVDLGDPRSIRVEVAGQNLAQAIKNAPDRRTKRLLRCIKRAEGDVARISRCNGVG